MKINPDGIDRTIVNQITENIFEDMYLIFDMQASYNLRRKTKERALFEVITSGLSRSVLSQDDFPKFYQALIQNILANMELLRHVRKTGLIPPLYKLEMIRNLILDQLNRDVLFSSHDDNLDDETLSEYDEVISLYGDVPPISDVYGRELRIQLHLIKNSELHFADPEKKAELLEELLLQNEADEFREFFIVDSLYRAMKHLS
ncbi:MAG: hypothetical protein HQM11_08450 [SAR324 cluster bacterium]|nr:hypothetical protein [SAR324 cluster bacterium]